MGNYFSSTNTLTILLSYKTNDPAMWSYLSQIAICLKNNGYYYIDDHNDHRRILHKIRIGHRLNPDGSLNISHELKDCNKITDNYYNTFNPLYILDDKLHLSKWSTNITLLNRDEKIAVDNGKLITIKYEDPNFYLYNKPREHIYTIDVDLFV